MVNRALSEGISLIAFDTKMQTCRLELYEIYLNADVKQRSCFQFFCMNPQRNQPHVFRLRNGRSSTLPLRRSVSPLKPDFNTKL